MNSFSFTLFISLAVLSFLNSTGAATCHPDDEAGLLDFKSSITRDPSGILNSWKKGTSCCSWDGITCINGDRVTSLSLVGFSEFPGRSLSGTFSSSLAKLQHLEEISLGDQTNITGPFPQFLLQLPKLTYIDIRNNRLSGPLPNNIGVLSNLQNVHFEGNRFTGSIPDSISNLTRLNTLFLSDNLLTGTIPLGIVNLKLLAHFILGGNRLSGTIPDIFKNMTQLYALDLSRNNFSGELPPSFVSLAPTLKHLELSQNNLSGKIPTYLSRFTKLEKLDLSKNRYSGVIPKGFINLSYINELILSHNMLTDPLPILNFKFIEFLDLSYNQFHLKKIPKWVTSLSVISLKLAKCGIEMSLDDLKLTAPSYLSYIDISENKISGSPANLLNQTEESLVRFLAAGNKLRFDLGKLKFPRNLDTLDLSRNLVFGQVPATVVGLHELNLSQNHLCGKLPVTNFPISAFSGNKCLCGSPLSPCKV